MTVNLSSIKGGVVSFLAAVVASLCCLLPLAVVILGLGSGAFMMVTMQYRTIFLPIGVIGVAKVVIFPLLVVFFILAFYGWSKRKEGTPSCG